MTAQPRDQSDHTPPLKFPPTVGIDPPWPDVEPVAFHGLAGEIVAAMLPQTEADAVGLLANLLVAFGSCVGPAPHALAEQHRHGANLFVVQIGESGKGRKGSAWRQVRALFKRVDEGWDKDCIVSGLSSGEGLIHAVRDRETAASGDAPTPTADRRILVVEEEFGGTLKVMGREGNTLSSVLRQAWDGGRLKTLTRADPLTATDPHISIIGHVTRGELERYLTENDTSNGFANRFLWLCVRRSKKLPRGGQPIDLDGLAHTLHQAIMAARIVTRPVQRSDAAEARWDSAYDTLTDGQPGLIGAITGRAEAQALRLALVYALLDRSPVVEAAHLEAALALWRYCEASAHYVFGDALGDPVSDTILTALQDAAPEAVSTTDLSALFNRHTKSSRIRASLRDLQRAGLVDHRSVPTEGATRTVWFACREA